MTPRRSLAGLAVAVIAVFAGWQGLRWWEAGHQAQQSIPPPVPVTVGVAVLKDVPQYIHSIGTAQAYNTAAVKSRLDGPIAQVLFADGQDVKAGDPLFKIEPTIYQAQLDAAIAKKAQDDASLANAQLDLQRDLHVGPLAVTQQAIDTQKALVAQDQALSNADAATIADNRAVLGFTNIVSPISGRTGARQVDPGNYVLAAQATTLVTVTQIKPIYVTFTAPQSELQPILDRQRLSPLPVEALSADGKSVLASGLLTFIDNQVSTTTGTVDLKAEFANADGKLWPGQFVNVRLTLTTLMNVVTVPTTTVMQGADGDFAYVIGPNDTAQRRDVAVGFAQDGYSVITKGIKPGERVVVDGQYRLADNMRVKVEAPASAPLANLAAAAPLAGQRHQAGAGGTPAPAVAP